MLIQDAMPDLTADEREFIMTGSHGNDWADMIGDWNADDFAMDDLTNYEMIMKGSTQ
jgi:hypothetical protein